ncbi:MAG: hypothetical protein ACRC2Y_05050 [Aeromonas veronii]
MEEIKDQIQTLEEPELIAVPAPAFWLSQANTEFGGNQWGSNILAKAGLPAPQWLSNLAGKANASHQFTIAPRGNGWVGFQDTSGVPVYGQMTPRSVSGAPELTEFVIRPDNVAWSWMSVYGWFAGRIQASIPNGPSATFVFTNDPESASVEGDIAGLANYIIARTGQTIGINIWKV